MAFDTVFYFTDICGERIAGLFHRGAHLALELIEACDDGRSGILALVF